MAVVVIEWCPKLASKTILVALGLSASRQACNNEWDTQARVTMAVGKLRVVLRTGLRHHLGCLCVRLQAGKHAPTSGTRRQGSLWQLARSDWCPEPA